MSESCDTQLSGKAGLVIKLIDRYGLSLVILGIMIWFNYQAVQFERESMMGEIRDSKTVNAQLKNSIDQLPAAIRRELEGKK